jgi:hypothetical protein
MSEKEGEPLHAMAAENPDGTHARVCVYASVYVFICACLCVSEWV